MFCRVSSAVICGIDSSIVNVEADVSNGMPLFEMVGDLSPHVKEAKGRVRTGIKNSGYEMSAKHIVVNISPANIRKEGTLLDLPIAISVMAGYGYVKLENLEKTVIAGELSLDGSINPVAGIIAVVIAAKEAGYKKCIIPYNNVKEGKAIKGIEVVGVSSLKQAVDYINDGITIKQDYEEKKETDIEEFLDFCEINGQEAAKRAVEVAVAGLHNFLMIGSPGAGKTMIAKRIPTIMPDLSEEEMIEVTKVYSISNLIDSNSGMIKNRPFRSPHHTITATSLAGGGAKGKPGEVTLANKGVLFLDELSEFDRNVLEVLRQPLEEKMVSVSRIHGKYTYPANFMLVAATNPCKCGYYPDISKCTCTPKEISRYFGKISGPLLDRIDICIDVPKVEYNDIVTGRKSETSNEIKKRVEAAYELQKERYKNTGISYNSELNIAGVKEYCRLGKRETEYMGKVFDKMNLSVRSYHRVLKTARTIADLAEEKDININYISEAVCYKLPDKKY